MKTATAEVRWYNAKHQGDVHVSRRSIIRYVLLDNVNESVCEDSHAEDM